MTGVPTWVAVTVAALASSGWIVGWWIGNRRSPSTGRVVWVTGRNRRRMEQTPGVYLYRRHEPTGHRYGRVTWGPTDDVKVGFSSRPVRDRVAEWRPGVPGRVVLVGLVPGGDRKTESRIHRALSRWRVEREWFRLPVDDDDWRGVIEREVG